MKTQKKSIIFQKRGQSKLQKFVFSFFVRLSNSTWDSVIQSIIAVKVEPRFTKSFEMASFLTVRKGGESGYGDWIRLWGVLSRDRLLIKIFEI